MPKDCRETALRYLEHRVRSADEVKTHLASKGFHEEEISETMQFLLEFHYVDDAGYCAEYIRYGAGKGRGPVRLQFELAEKGIDAALIRQGIEEHFDRQTEQDAALREAKKLLKPDTARKVQREELEEEPDVGKPDEKTLAKIGRKLASQGYHTEVIYDIIGQLRK